MLVQADNLLRTLQNIPTTLDFLQITVTKVEIRGLLRIIIVNFYHHWALVAAVVHFDEIITMSVTFLNGSNLQPWAVVCDLSRITYSFVQLYLKSTIPLLSFNLFIFKTSNESLKGIRTTLSSLLFVAFLLNNFLHDFFRLLYPQP